MATFYVVEQGNGKITQDGNQHTLSLPTAARSVYSNAMLTSYQSRSDFSFGPVTRLQLNAHVEGNLHGTAGFGFWNHPYGHGLRLPRAVWYFFSSRPSQMPLAIGVPGHGFKAAVFDAQRWLFYALLPVAPLGMLLMRVPGLYRRLWPAGQRALGVDEVALDAALLQTPRRYAIEWQSGRVQFTIDRKVVFVTHRMPRGKLGFVAWIDNQYAIVTPQGRFGFGLVDVPNSQKLILSDIELTTSA